MRKKYEPDDEREVLKSARRIYILNKPRSSYRIEYIESPDDPWFIYVVKIKKTTGVYESCSMIIAKDTNVWLNADKGNGWEITSSN